MTRYIKLWCEGIGTLASIEKEGDIIASAKLTRDEVAWIEEVLILELKDRSWCYDWLSKLEK